MSKSNNVTFDEEIFFQQFKIIETFFINKMMSGIVKKWKINGYLFTKQSLTTNMNFYAIKNCRI